MAALLDAPGALTMSSASSRWKSRSTTFAPRSAWGLLADGPGSGRIVVLLLVPHLAASFGRDVAYLHGGTPKKRRDEMVARFQSGDGPSIFLLSLKAGGTGLNLTAANHVVHLDRWWNPAVENQATDRVFRIGQRRTVQVRRFICTGTLEEKIDEMLEEKKALGDLVVTGGEGWLTELPTRDLCEVFALSEGAVGE